MDGNSSTARSLDREFSSVATSEPGQPSTLPASRYLEIESDRETLGDLARRTADPSFGSSQFPYQGPARTDGGYQGADRRNAAANGRSSIFLNTYIGTHEVLPGSHADPIMVLMMSSWIHDTDTLGKTYYFQSLEYDHSTKDRTTRIHSRESLHRLK